MRFGFTALVLASAVAAAEVPYVGLELAPVGEELGAYLGVTGGARIVAVEAGSPADKAGFKVLDIVTAWDGNAVTDPGDLAAKVKATPIGKEVTAKVFRKGGEAELKVAVGKREAPQEEAQPGQPPAPEKKPGFLGIAFGPVPAVLAEYLELGEKPGAMVLEVVKDTPAAKAGLKERDLIRSVNGQAIESPDHFRKLMADLAAGDKVKIEFLRAAKPEQVELTLDPRPEKMPALERSFRVDPLGKPQAGGRGKVVMKWRDADGKEHEETIETPFGSEGFEFNIPHMEWFAPGQADATRRHLEQALERAKKQLEQFNQDMQRKHTELRGKLQTQHGTIEQAPGAQGSRSVVIRNDSMFVTTNDGEHEISIKAEDGVKTVTVKKGEEVIAKDLPFDKISELPEAVQKKVKDLEAGIKVQVDGDAIVPRIEHRRTLGTPTEAL